MSECKDLMYTNKDYEIFSETRHSEECQVYKRRWIHLFLFSACNFWNSFHWIEYSIIANSIAKYYTVPLWTVDWLALLYMVAYVVCVLPTTYLLDKKGLRVTVVLGIFGTALGAWIKVLSVSPELFYVTFLGQGLEALACAFLFGVPPRLAAVWFGPDQVSTASGIGVMAAELGIAAGFLIPPKIVKYSESIEDIGISLKLVHYIGSVPPTILLIIILIVFQEKPPKPPSVAQVRALTHKRVYWRSFLSIIRNRSFLLLLGAYTLFHAVLTSISTLLSQIVVDEFPGHEDDSGLLGNGNMCVSIVGGFLIGIWLDKTHRFKESNLVIYSMSFLAMLGFTLSIYFNSLTAAYVFFIGAGFFFGAYTTLGYELGVELTYPEPEGTTSGILNMAYFILSIFLTLFAGWVLRLYGHLATNLFFCAVIALGLVFSLLIRGKLKRQEAQCFLETVCEPKEIA